MVMILGNRKVRLLVVVREQVKVFKNAKTHKVSIWDHICFWVLPIVASYISVFKIGIVINKSLAEVLTTVFSIIFTVLFGFAAILICKIDSGNKTERQVAEETFVSIVSSTILSLIATVLSIIFTQLKCEELLQIISTMIIAISLIIIMLLLLITKRIFYLYIKKKDQ